VAVNVAVLAPAGTATVAGRVAMAAFELLKLTTAPPEGALLLKVTVPWEELPPITDAGLILTVERLAAGGGVVARVTVRIADGVASKNAVIVSRVSVETANVVTLKLAEVCPAGTATIGGGLATDGLLVASVTVIPPAGAGALRKIVPVALVPPATLAGVNVIDFSNGGAFGSGATLINDDFVTPPAVASMRTVAPTATEVVVMAKLLVLFPAAMPTVAGT